MHRRLSLVAFAGALALAGCTSPETAEEPMVTGVCAAGLTLATGNAKEGTVTVASLPLLSYYHFKEDPTTHDRTFRVCWAPLLGSFESEQHNIREVVRHLKAPPSCPDDEPPPAPPPKRGRIIIRTEEDDAPPPPPRPTPPRAPSASTSTPTSTTSSTTTASDPLAPSPSRIEPAAASPQPAPTATPRAAVAPVPAPAPSARPVDENAPGPNGARILRSEPATRTEVDVLFPLFHVARERPGTAVIQRPGRKTKSLVEVGDSTDHVRALPLFSYSRVPEREKLTLWPLLACGFENDASGKHLVLFYFLKIRTGDPEKAD